VVVQTLQNQTQTYIGGLNEGTLKRAFFDWLNDRVDTDTVRYTVDTLTPDNPDTPEDESALQVEGVRVTGLKVITVETDFAGRESTPVAVE
ncbi:hypothetical protein ACC674_37900, partial [Rhizobium ruizarguesonis]